MESGDGARCVVMVSMEKMELGDGGVVVAGGRWGRGDLVRFIVVTFNSSPPQGREGICWSCVGATLRRFAYESCHRIPWFTLREAIVIGSGIGRDEGGRPLVVKQSTAIRAWGLGTDLTLSPEERSEKTKNFFTTLKRDENGKLFEDENKRLVHVPDESPEYVALRQKLPVNPIGSERAWEEGDETELQARVKGGPAERVGLSFARNWDMLQQCLREAFLGEDNYHRGDHYSTRSCLGPRLFLLCFSYCHDVVLQDSVGNHLAG